MHLPTRPAHPERICWGCDRYCPADALGCANGSVRTPHPCELFGDDWLEWELDRRAPAAHGDPTPVSAPADPTAARRP
jgi:hypothetical protein